MAKENIAKFFNAAITDKALAKKVALLAAESGLLTYFDATGKYGLQGKILPGGNLYSQLNRSTKGSTGQYDLSVGMNFGNRFYLGLGFGLQDIHYREDYEYYEQPVDEPSPDNLLDYFRYPFVVYAVVVGVLIALCSSLLGVTLVLKRFSFIGDGLSHVAFGAMAIAAALKLSNNFLLVLPVTVGCAVALLYAGQNNKIRGDAAIAMLSVGALAIGYLVMNLFAKSANISGDVCATLFGSTSILTLSPGDVLLCAVLSLAVIAVFLLFYHKIFAVTFDEDFAAATGTHAKQTNLLLAVIIAVIIVLAMNLVGSLLISALVIFPALSAMRVFKSFRSVTVCAVVVSVGCAVLGILASILAGTPVGATIVAVNIVCFALFTLAGALAGRRRSPA